MNSEWWDMFFNDLYNRFKIALIILVSISGITRVITSAITSFEAAFKTVNFEGFFASIFLILVLEFLKNKSIGIKKIVLYIILEFLNFVFKYYSVHIYQNEYVLYCLTSTIFTILFQTSIFQNHYHVILIVIKHLCL